MIRELFKKLIRVLAIFSLPILLSSCVFANGLAKIDVHVVDESGASVSNADVEVRLSSGQLPVQSSADIDGYVIVTARSNDGVIVGKITKNGFYDSIFTHDFYVRRMGLWQPWEKEITVTLRPIVNPVPMYVRNSSFKVPAFGKELGFDLEKADWVAPHGAGAHSDFIFRVDQVYNDRRNFDARLTLTFANTADGILVAKEASGGDFDAGSLFRLPRIAPEEGYLTGLKKRNSRGTYGRYVDWDESNNYIFRVRSVVNENGALQQAMYGKIRGEIRYTPGDGGKITMYYYLNPDYTTNLEFDPKHNLFQSLVKDEWTTIP